MAAGPAEETSAEIPALSEKTADAEQAIAQSRNDLAVSREALALSHAAFEAASASNKDKNIALQDRQKQCEEMREMKNNAEAQAAATMAQSNEHKQEDLKDNTLFVKISQAVIMIQQRRERKRAVFLRRTSAASDTSRRPAVVHVIKIRFEQ